MEITVIPTRIIYYNEEGNYGIISCKTTSNKVQKNQYNNIALTGNMMRLETGKKYIADVEGEYNKKYGIQYKVKYIYEDLPITNEDEKEYLKTLLTEKQVEEIYKTYPEGGIIELIETDKFNYEQVKGLGEIMYKKMKDKLLCNLKYQKGLIELSKYGITHKMILKLIDKYGDIELLLYKINNNPYILADEVMGVSFIKCDNWAENMGIEKTSNIRINAGIKHILKIEAKDRGHSWVYKKYITEQLEKLLNIDVNIIKEYIQNNNIDGIYVDNNRLALKQNYYYETKIYEKIIELNTVSNMDINVEKRIKETEEEQGFTFTDKQKEAIYSVIKNNILVVTGSAGTGKSSLIKGIVNVLGIDYYTTCALSGKAVRRIIESTGMDSQTIHRVLKYNPKFGFMHNKDNQLDYELIIIDEMSMVDNWLFYSLITSIKEGTKVILVGDIEQLEPIGAGFILRDLLESKIIKSVKLDTIHRQAEKSGILSVANQIRKGNHIDYSKTIFGELKDLYMFGRNTDKDVFDKIIDMCRGYKGDIMEFQVIVPLKTKGYNSVKRLNRELQEIFNPNSKGLIKGEKEFRVNDKVIQNGNNYDDGVFNGTMGRIINIDLDNKAVEIDFVDAIVKYGEKDLDKINLAYAITTHRSQGSEYDIVVFGLDYSAYVMLSKQLIYTGITRASKSCVIVCEKNAFIQGVETNKAYKRNTFLGELLSRGND